MESVKKHSKALKGELLQIGVPPQGNPPVFKTYIPELDNLFVDAQGTPVGGIKLGTHQLLAGTPKVGKSLVTLHLLAAAQKQKLRAAFVDAERTVFSDGVGRIEYFGINATKTGGIRWIGHRADGVSYVIEEVLGLIYQLAVADEIDVVFIDSLTGLIPRARAKSLEATLKATEAKNMMKDGANAQVAAAFAAHMPGAAGACSDHNVSLIMLGQQRENPRVFEHMDPRYIPGGRAVMHACGTIFWVTRTGKSSWTKAQEEHAQNHHYLTLTIKESRQTARAGEKFKIALPTDRPLWESPFYTDAT